MRTCADCNAILLYSDCGLGLGCAIRRAKRLEAQGVGDWHCRDCRNVFPATFDDDGAAVAVVECEGCGGDDIEPMSKAHERARRAEIARGLA